MTVTEDPITALALKMGVTISPGMDPLSPQARVAVNKVLNDLDEEEREGLVIMGAVGRWDWHMVDGTDRIWHFTASGSTSWNLLTHNSEAIVLRRAYQLRERVAA